MIDHPANSGYFLSLGQLKAVQQTAPPTFECPAAELETALLSQAARLGQYPLWLLLYEDYRVSWAFVDQEGLHLNRAEKFSPDFLQELRLFGPDGELYLWRAGEVFQGRLRLDRAGGLPHWQNESAETAGYAPPTQAEPPDFADEWQVLWGTRLAEPVGSTGWPEIYEERGVRLALPHPLTGPAELPLRLRVRHYIDYDPASGLAYFADLRLVELRDKARQPLGWL